MRRPRPRVVPGLHYATRVVIGSRSEGSSFSALLTRVEIGYIHGRLVDPCSDPATYRTLGTRVPHGLNLRGAVG